MTEEKETTQDPAVEAHAEEAEPKAETSKPKEEKPKKPAKAKAKSPTRQSRYGDGAAAASKGGADVQAALKAVMKLSAEDRKTFIAEYVGGLSVLELNDQVKTLEEVFDVSPILGAGMMLAAAPAPGTGTDEAAEKTAFDVILKAVGDKTRRVQVIKTVRDVLSVALKEAKAFVDGAPGTVKEGASKDEAEKIKTELEAAGATVELR